MKDLVLSLFPGIGLLDQAFEERGCCVVRGPDLLWGGDIIRFHPPPETFDGIIGGPPCQLFSVASRIGGTEAVNQIPEFERCIREAQPDWFLMENVVGAPLPVVGGYRTVDTILCDDWVGGLTARKRRFTYGYDEYESRLFAVQQMALHEPEPAKTVLASTAKSGNTSKPGRRPDAFGGLRGDLPVTEYGRLQGCEPVVDRLVKIGASKRFILHVIGNGVSLAMGRAIAEAVERANVSVAALPSSPP